MSKLRIFALAVVVSVMALVGTWALGQDAPAPQAKPSVQKQQDQAASRPAPAQTAEAKQFGGWTVTCPANAGNRCVMFQQVSEALSRKVVFIWLIQYNEKGELVGAFTLPSGVFIKPGIVVKGGSEKPSVRVDYTRCDQAECQAIFPMSPKFVQQVSSAKTVSIDIALTNGNTASVGLDMTGFDAALSALGGAR